MEPHVRWVRKFDLPQIHAIASQAFKTAWSLEDFGLLMRQRGVRGKVAMVGKEIAGYMFYGIDKDRLVLLSLATRDKFARQGVATHLVQKLSRRLTSRKRPICEIDVPEDALHFQFLLQKEGFRATQILKNHFQTDEGDLDGYRFLFTLPLDDRLPQSRQPKTMSVE